MFMKPTGLTRYVHTGRYRFRQYPAVTTLPGAGHKRERLRQVRTSNAGSPHILCNDRTFQETNPMQKSSIMMLIASSILIAGILVAGCTDSSAASQTSSTPSPTAAQAVITTSAGSTGGLSSSMTPDQASTGDKPQFNQSAGPQGTPPDGIQMNGTRPSGTPLGGMQMNGTRPSGTPPSGTPPS